MTTAVKAVYENGVFKPKEPVELQENTEVEVLIPAPFSVDSDDPTGWKAAEQLIGFIKDAPPDMADNHDFFLYGRPRRRSSSTPAFSSAWLLELRGDGETRHP